jgi:hypothetical protein
MSEVSSLSSQLVTIIFCSFWACFAARKGQRANLFELAPYERVVSGHWIPFRDVLGAFAFFLLAQVVFWAALGCLWVAIQTGQWGAHPPESFANIQGWINTGSIFLSAAVLALYCKLIEPLSYVVSQGGAASSHWFIRSKDLVKGMFCWFIAYPFVMIVNQVVSIFMQLLGVASQEEQVAVHYVKSTMSNPLLFFFTTAGVICIVPILEETLFRGFFQTWAKQRWGRMYAITITSALFACFHFSASQGIKNIELLLSLYTLSCFLGFVFERYRSIWVPIGLHGTFNGISIAMIFFQEVSTQ